MGVLGKVVAIASLAATVATALPASARLPEAFSNLPKEIERRAVHVPTGCLASIVVNDRVVVSAKIVDPDCLPKGVSARPVPGKARDFTVIDGVH